MLGLIVEGDTEFRALPRLRDRLEGCPAIRAVNLGGVGEGSAPAGIATQVVPKIGQLRRMGCGSVVLCLDRERRTQCAPSLAREVFTEIVRRLEARGEPGSGVIVVIADRSFEAWLLAGGPELRNPRSRWRPPGTFEGHLGIENALGKVELSQMLGRRYEKVRDGVQLFGRLDLAAARRRSRSLDKLLRGLVG